MNKKVVLLPVLLFFWMAACSEAPQPQTSEPTAADGLPDHDPELATRLIDEGGLLLDVRTPEEYSEGHAEGSTNIPVQELSERLGELEGLVQGDKRRPIVVYCRSGGRAGRAKTLLLDAGFDRVTNLGGLTDWPGKKIEP